MMKVTMNMVTTNEGVALGKFAALVLWMDWELLGCDGHPLAFACF